MRKTKRNGNAKTAVFDNYTSYQNWYAQNESTVYVLSQRYLKNGLTVKYIDWKRS